MKQRTGTAPAIASQPMVSDNCVTMVSSVMPSSEGRLAGFFMMFMPAFYMRQPVLSVYNDDPSQQNDFS